MTPAGGAESIVSSGAVSWITRDSDPWDGLSFTIDTSDASLAGTYQMERFWQDTIAPQDYFRLSMCAFDLPADVING